MTYSGGRRQLVLFLDRELAAELDRLAEAAETGPEQLAVALLRRDLLTAPEAHGARP